MSGLTRSLVAPAASLAMLVTLGLGGIAYADASEPAAQPDCSAEQQIVDSYEAGPPGTPSLLDLRGTVEAAIAADNAAGATADSEATVEAKGALDARLGQIANVQADLDACLAAGDEPPATTEPPVTDEPTTEPPATEPPFVDRDCGDLAPGEADEILAADPSDPHRLDRDNDGVPCEIEDLADEGANPDDGPTTAPTGTGSDGTTSGSGSNSQFDAMPSYAPETGRA